MKARNWLLGITLLATLSLQAPLDAGAAATPPGAAGASSIQEVPHAGEVGQCVYNNVGGLYVVGDPGWECGATLSGPTSLTLGPCPTSGVLGSSDQPITKAVLKQYLCTPAFTMSLSFSAQASPPTSSNHGVPPLGIYAPGATNELLEPGWCPAHINGGECNAETSVPQRILVLKGTKPAPAELYVQGLPGCQDDSTVFSCDYQATTNIRVGGTTTVSTKRTKGPLAITLSSTASSTRPTSTWRSRS
jgi:hypothetical protein